ncbi:MAG: CoA pyrophosphatase [Bernardetiaceae bacterium]|jgi:8-oxo-dGTP pyrophosphatase MutT (NUDIX family)|nr:CoA pyrophosphatase [Bernardetiaceae bacterium]
MPASFTPDLLRQALARRAADPHWLPSFARYQAYHQTPAGVTPRLAAVLLALGPVNGQVGLPFIVRPRYDGAHSGQVAFPGGRYEPADGTLERTALRETEEEIGLTVPPGQVLGRLSEVYVQVSNTLVTPVVAWLPALPALQPDPREVAEILLITLAHLQAPANQGKTEITLANGNKAKFEAYFFQGHPIWGATGRIVQEFLELLTVSGVG